MTFKALCHSIPYARTWTIGLATGTLSAGPVVYFQHSAPWLISIPILLGGLLACAWEIRAEPKGDLRHPKCR